MPWQVRSQSVPRLPLGAALLLSAGESCSNDASCGSTTRAQLRRVEAESAIVLRRTALGESDLMISFYCRSLGKVTAMARSARRSKKRFGAAIDFFSRVEVTLVKRPSAQTWALESAVPVQLFDRLASNMGCLAHGSYGTELVRELTVDESPDSDVYDLLTELYWSLQDDGAKAGRLRIFELRLLGILGLNPIFDRCTRCNRTDLRVGTRLDPESGGIVCGECAGLTTGAWVRLLPLPAIEFLRLGQSLAQSLTPISCGDELEGHPQALAGRKAMLALVHWHVGKPLQSVQFIADVQRSSAVT